MWELSYWVFPVISGVSWLVTLITLLIDWIAGGRVSYSSMEPGQTIPYISDVGAQELKPLFITGCIITAISLDCAFASERWMRHLERPWKDTDKSDRAFGILTIIFAFIGTLGQIMLSICDTARYPKPHTVFVLLFIAGFIISGIFMCWEFRRLGDRYCKNKILVISFWVKLVFIVVETSVAVAFATCEFLKISNAAAVLEWAVGFIFTLYIFSYLIDLLPSVHKKPDSCSETGIAANIS